MNEVNAEGVVGQPFRNRPLPVKVTAIDGEHQQPHADANQRLPQAFAGADPIEAAGILLRLALEATAEQDQGCDQRDRTRKRRCPKADAKAFGEPGHPVAATAERAGCKHHDILREVGGVDVEDRGPLVDRDTDQESRCGHHDDEAGQAEAKRSIVTQRHLGLAPAAPPDQAVDDRE